ncbi:MAG: type II secretion system GspH family protein [Solobacterium sp.]|nr:type II secretion system GspH family protein [Solobacterium sp.]
MKNKKKGFTLVELIVVLAILAILAAMLVPALTGYIDKANQKKVVAETRQIVVAAQTIASEDYAKGKVDANYVPDTDDILKLAELSGKGTLTIAKENVNDTTGTIEYLKWQPNKGKWCEYRSSGDTYTLQS